MRRLIALIGTIGPKNIVVDLNSSAFQDSFTHAKDHKHVSANVHLRMCTRAARELSEGAAPFPLRLHGRRVLRSSIRGGGCELGVGGAAGSCSVLVVDRRRWECVRGEGGSEKGQKMGGSASMHMPSTCMKVSMLPRCSGLGVVLLGTARFERPGML